MIKRLRKVYFKFFYFFDVINILDIVGLMGNFVMWCLSWKKERNKEIRIVREF